MLSPKTMLGRIGGIAFLGWEVWWAYVFFSTPRPDEEMLTIAPLFFGLVLPGFVIFILWFRWIQRPTNNKLTKPNRPDG